MGRALPIPIHPNSLAEDDNRDRAQRPAQTPEKNRRDEFSRLRLSIADLPRCRSSARPGERREWPDRLPFGAGPKSGMDRNGCRTKSCSARPAASRPLQKASCEFNLGFVARFSIRCSRAPVVRQYPQGRGYNTLSILIGSEGISYFYAMETTTRDAVDELLQTYGETGGINYLDAAATLPSRLAVEAACAELMSLMFPGFRSEALVSSEDLAETTRARMRNLHARLKTEICRSLGKIPPNEAIEAKADEILSSFMSKLPQLRRVLWTDIDAAYEGDPAAKSYEEIILAYPALEAIAIYRMAHELYDKVPLVPRIMTEWAHSRTGIDIHPGAKIGPHFFIDHGTGVVIGETSEIGSRVKLYHGVTLGARSFQKDERGKIKKGGKRHPKVEDDVTIYPNSTILGGETVIGARSTIGGNVFLVQSVPPDSLVYYEEKQLRIVPKRKRRPASSRDEFRE